MSILSSIMTMVTPVIIDRLAATLGISSATARTAINFALPLILGAFAKKAATPAGAGELFSAVGQADKGLFGSLDSALSGSGKDQMINSGMSTLNDLLGGGTVNSLTSTLGSKAGLGAGAASMLVPLLGQMALSGIAKSGIAKSASGLASMLSQEAGSYASAEAPRAPSMPSAPAAAAPGGMGMLKWLVPLVALAAILWYFMSGTPAPEKAAMPDAVTPAALTVEGIDVGKTLTDTFGTLTTTFGTVTDAATAQTALPKLQEVAASVDKVTGVAGKFSAEQKTAIGALIASALPAVRAAADKALAGQGVGDLLKPVVDGIFAKIEALAK